MMDDEDDDYYNLSENSIDKCYVQLSVTHIVLLDCSAFVIVFIISV